MQIFIYDHKGMINNTMWSIQCLHSLNLTPSSWYFKNVVNGSVIFFFSVGTDLDNTNQNVSKHAIGIPPHQSLDCQHPLIWEGMLGHSGS